MKPGDPVITHQGEYGVIDHAWDRDTNEYDWWVLITFWSHSKQRNFTSLIPFRASELYPTSVDKTQYPHWLQKKLQKK